MNLHLDKDAFGVLIEDIHSRTGYRTDVLEKDYYVALILKELAEKQAAGLPAYFKGGTALYKALKTTNRFSEDIDLSVDARGCSRTQNDKRLEAAAKKYSSLERDVVFTSCCARKVSAQNTIFNRIPKTNHLCLGCSFFIKKEDIRIFISFRLNYNIFLAVHCLTCYTVNANGSVK